MEQARALTAIFVRLATLQDTRAITAIHTSHIRQWEHLESSGQLVAVPYESLSLYERWQHGGAWLSIETCAVHLNRLLAGTGVPLVAEVDGQVLGTAEVYEGFEPAPFGHNLNLAVLIVHADYLQRGIGQALMHYISQMAKLMKCERITVSHAEARDFYIRQGFRVARTGREIKIPTNAGRAIYQVHELTNHDPDQIKNWYMPLGHYQSARQEWEQLFPQVWAAGMPELLNIPTAHLTLTVAGQNAIVYFQDAIDHEPGTVNLQCWSPRPLTGPLITALRDKAHRDGYKTILSYILDADRGLLGTDVEQSDTVHEHLELAL
jgi:predicted N-acetyltransferase YhbS